MNVVKSQAVNLPVESSQKPAILPIKLIEKTALITTKIKRKVAWRFAQFASMPSQIAGNFSRLYFVEKKLLQPRYQKALREYQSKLPVLDPLDAKIVNALERTGIYVTSLESLGIPHTPEFLEAASHILLTLKETSNLPVNQNKYQIEAPSDKLMEHLELYHWGLNDRLLKIVERYLGLPVAYDGLTFILSVADGREIGQRAWHKDREDRRMIKVCVYLNDVDEEGGPFECLKPEINSLLCNSVPEKDRYKSVFTEEVNALLNAGVADGVQTCTGPKGTVIFVDTARNYHRGKPPTKSNRYAIFFSYFSRTPWHPFFCQRSPFSKKDVDSLTKGLSCDQQACVRWHDTLPKIVKLIPKNRL